MSPVKQYKSASGRLRNDQCQSDAWTTFMVQLYHFILRCDTPSFIFGFSVSGLFFDLLFCLEVMSIRLFARRIIFRSKVRSPVVPDPRHSTCVVPGMPDSASPVIHPPVPRN